MVVGKVEHVEWHPVSELVETLRNEGGFGHTGKI
jgi:dUTP pyrophosphatase